MKNKALFIVTLFFLLGCKQEQSSTDILTLSVDLEQSSLRYDDVFSNAEIILLETTDSSLISKITNVDEYKSNYYIHDIRSVKALAFDYKGKFICQLGRKGQGPGEYSWLASIAIDKENDIIHLVEPLGRFHNYSPDGKYINSPKYPDGNDYQHLHHFDNYMAAWTISSGSQSDCIIIFNPETMEIVNSYCNGTRLLKEGNFYTYKNELFYYALLEPFRRVYKVSKDSLTLLYQWDFGNDNFDMYDLDLTYKDENYAKEYDLFWRYMKDGTVPYLVVEQAQNNNYYYACLRFQYKYDKNVFYRKSDGKYLVFGEEDWPMKTNSHVFTDDYMIIALNPDNYENFKPYLPDSERKKLDTLTEDDNPCLLKLYFKK